MGRKDCFYVDCAEIFDAAECGSYASKAKYTPIKTIMCDIQPISADLKDMPHGMAAESCIKIFCNADEDIILRRYIKADGVFYLITGIKKWRMGYEILAERRDINEN